MPSVPARLLLWRASLTRKRGRVLGFIKAPTRESAEAAAVREFNLSDDQRLRLVILEIPLNKKAASRVARDQGSSTE
jgi:hypothetical protein